MAGSNSHAREGGQPKGGTRRNSKKTEDRRVEFIRFSERVKDHHRRSARAAEEDIVTLHEASEGSMEMGASRAHQLSVGLERGLCLRSGGRL